MDFLATCVLMYTSWCFCAFSARRTISFGINCIPVLFGLMRDTTRLASASFRLLARASFGMNTSDSMVQVDRLFEQRQQQLQHLHREIVTATEDQRRTRATPASSFRRTASSHSPTQRPTVPVSDHPWGVRWAPVPSDAPDSGPAASHGPAPVLAAHSEDEFAEMEAMLRASLVELDRAREMPPTPSQSARELTSSSGSRPSNPYSRNGVPSSEASAATDNTVSTGAQSDRVIQRRRLEEAMGLNPVRTQRERRMARQAMEQETFYRVHRQ